MVRRLFLAVLGTALVFSGFGCRHFGRPPAGCDRCPPSGSRGGDRFLGDPLPPGGGIPPPAVPTSPELPSVLPDSRSSYRFNDVGPSPGAWVPVTPGSPNRSLPPKSSKEPLYAEAPKAAPPSNDLPEKPKTFLEEPVRPDSGPPASVPDSPPSKSGSAFLGDPVAPSIMPRSAVGLPGYAVVPGRDGVSAGRRPTLEGFDWLKKSGFRTVVYLHASGIDSSAIREMATQRGLRFVPIAVSPTSVKTAFEEFATALADRSSKPIYVADDDGLRSAGLFYLLFRTSDLLGDDAARLRASPLGTLDTATEEQKQFWLAVQDYLAKR